jgi:hypothetical protein
LLITRLPLVRDMPGGSAVDTISLINTLSSVVSVLAKIASDSLARGGDEVAVQPSDVHELDDNSSVGEFKRDQMVQRLRESQQQIDLLRSENKAFRRQLTVLRNNFDKSVCGSASSCAAENVQLRDLICQYEARCASLKNLNDELRDAFQKASQVYTNETTQLQDALEQARDKIKTMSKCLVDQGVEFTGEKLSGANAAAESTASSSPENLESGLVAVRDSTGAKISVVRLLHVLEALFRALNCETTSVREDTFEFEMTVPVDSGETRLCLIRFSNLSWDADSGDELMGTTVFNAVGDLFRKTICNPWATQLNEYLNSVAFVPA